ncbi:MAG: hypothetical protein ACLFQB_15150 [Chitinispirillaceae bacterium]
MKDRDALVGAGFDWGRMPLYNELFEQMVIACRDRTTALLDTPELKQRWDEKMSFARQDRRILSAAARFVVRRVETKSVQLSYRQAIKGNSMLRILAGNLDLVSLLGGYPKLVSQVRPEGRVIDAAYLSSAANRALELLAQKGIIMRDGTPENVAVLRQNGLITLNLRARDNIKEYAYHAFLCNPEYYKAHYCCRVWREQKKRLQSVV